MAKQTDVEERRADEPDAEVIALSVAEEKGVLPEADRRAPTSEVVVEPPEPVTVVAVEDSETPALVPTNDQLHVVKLREDGVKVTAQGSILE